MAQAPAQGGAEGGPGALAVVGCGRLGLTMALAFATKGFAVHCVDISSALVAAIADRSFRSDEPGVTEALCAIAPDDPRLRATTDLAAAAATADTVLICVDTPSTGGDRHYDHGKVGAVLSALNRHAASLGAEAAGVPRRVVVCCTVMPGYLVEVGAHLLRDSAQLRAGLLYNPLFIAQGEIMRGLLQPDLILIGEAGDRVGDSPAGNALTQLWGRVCEPQPAAAAGQAAAAEALPVRRMSWTGAEITKLSLNCFITMKIAFANMVGDVCDAAAARYAQPPGEAEAVEAGRGGEEGAGADADADALLAAAQGTTALREVCDKHAVLAAIGCDKRIGPLCLRPGYGFGGPCFPRDNRAFATVAATLGVEPILPRATDEANGVHAATQARQFRDLRAASYTFRDVAYKPGCPTPLIEESQKLRVAALLADSLREERSASAAQRVVVADRAAVLDQVRLTFGSRFDYRQLD